MKGLIFDCFGVLYGNSTQAFFNRCPEDQRQELMDAIKQADYGFIKHADFVSTAARLCGMDEAEVLHFLRSKHIRNQEMIDFVHSVKGQYKTALLSNISNGGLDGLFADGELDELFDTVVLSFEHHIVKPHPDIFRLTAQQLELDVSECIMIDDLADNCEGAEVSGMRAIQHVSNQLTFAHINEIVNGV